MSPSRTCVLVLTGWLVFAILASVWPAQLAVHWTAAGWGVLFFLLLDLILLLRATALDVVRQIPGTLPLGVWCDANLRVSNAGAWTLKLEVFDGIPHALDSHGMPRQLRLEPGVFADLHYQVKPKERGAHHFEACHLRLTSPLGLWRRNLRGGPETRIRVYPNFAAVRKYAQLATSHRLAQLGIHKKRRRGEGMEFHQLREYREGDSLRQIDWKATSRMRRLISRDYQDERDQQIVFLLDCGRRMRTKDGELSHFDHTLTAILLTAYVALREGDAAGLLTFAGEERWLPPHKTGAALDELLQALYDLQPTPSASDYLAAARTFTTRVRKRSLVVLVTNLRDEEDDTLLPALELLRARHLVLLANLRERTLEQALEEPVADFDSALLHGAIHEYLDQRRKSFERIHAQGALSLDVLPEQLPISMVNRYLALKRGGAL
jgi:uncharacterized protein (DUF58 family)